MDHDARHRFQHQKTRGVRHAGVVGKEDMQNRGLEENVMWLSPHFVMETWDAARTNPEEKELWFLPR